MRRMVENSRFTLDFLAASVMMLLSLSTGLIPSIATINRPNPFTSISALCKIRSYVLQSTTMTYRWLMSMACIDRYIHSCPDLRRHRLINIRLTRCVIGGIVLIWLILPFHQVIWNDVPYNICTFVNTSAGIYNSFFTIILGGFLPPLIMLICALLIRENLVNRRVRHPPTFTQPATGDQQKQLLRSRDRQALSMLYVQVFVYILSNLPWTMNLIYAAMTRSMLKTMNDLILDSFLRSLVELIVYLYPILSFYLYTLISRTFREELMKIFRVHRRVQPMM